MTLLQGDSRISGNDLLISIFIHLLYKKPSQIRVNALQCKQHIGRQFTSLASNAAP